MIQKLETKDLIKMIDNEKRLHHKQLAIKVYQVEFFKDARPKIYLQTMDLNKTENELKSLGFNVDYTKTEKSITSTVKQNKQILKSRNLKTTNLVISW